MAPPYSPNDPPSSGREGRETCTDDLLSWIEGKFPHRVGGFERRLCLQKATYLLKAFGHPLAKNFSYSVYIRGPYSPHLAEVYYEKSRGISVSPENKEEWEREHAEEMESVARAISRGPTFLEGIATTHWFAYRNPSKTREDILNHVSKLKSHIDREFLEEGWHYLEKVGLIRGHT